MNKKNQYPEDKEKKKQNSRLKKNEKELDKKIESFVDDIERSNFNVEEVPEEVVEKVKSADERELDKIEREYGISEKMSVEELESEYLGDSKSAGDVDVGKLAEEEETKEDESELVYQDGRFELKIAEDKMSAMISLYPSMGGGMPLSMVKIKKAMEDMGVIHGVNYDLLEKLIKKVEVSKEPKEDVIIAKGTEPEEGEDGKIEYFFQETDDMLREDDSEWIIKKKVN